MIEFIGNTIVNLNYKQCHTNSVQNNSMIVDINDDLSCQLHEEADTKIIYHTCHLYEDVFNVLIKTCDTDVLILLLGNMDHLHNNNLKIYMEYGTNNCKKWINISEICTKLGPSICQSLPGFHALTGCDFNPSFSRRGKKKTIPDIAEIECISEGIQRIRQSRNSIEERKNFPDTREICMPNVWCEIFKIK